MPRITLKSTGPLLDGRYRRVAPATLARWAEGSLGTAAEYLRSIAPVDTGRFRRSIRVRPSARGWNVRAVLFSSDNREKVGVIEDGYDPAGPRGHWNRKPTHVFARTYRRFSGLLGTQKRLLQADLVTALTQGRVTGRYRRAR